MEDLGARGRLRAREMKKVSEIKSKQPVRWRARGGNEDRGNYINDSMSKVERAREIKQRDSARIQKAQKIKIY